MGRITRVLALVAIGCTVFFAGCKGAQVNTSAAESDVQRQADKKADQATPNEGKGIKGDTGSGTK